jgi:hypothetical protein
VICLNGVIRVLLNSVQSGRDELIKDPRIDRREVGGDLDRDRAGAQRPEEEPPGGRQVTPLGQQDVDDLTVLVNRPVQVSPLTVCRSNTRLSG